MSGTVSAAARQLGHEISFAITLTLMIVVNAFMVHTLKHRLIKRKSWWYKYGPLTLTLLAVPFVMADLTRHVLNDWNVWQWCGNNMDFPRINQTWTDDCFWSSTQYKCNVPCCVPGTWDNQPAGTYPEVKDFGAAGDCNCNLCVPPEQENIAHLSFIGYLFTIFFTYTGFTLLAVGTLYNANIIKKLKEIRAQWRELREAHRNAV